MRKHFLLSASALMISSSLAYAADLPRRDAPSPPEPVAELPIFTWTGFYVGANIGWGGHRSRLRRTNTVPTGFPALGQIRSNSLIGGLQAGYNWQYGAMVLGLETDFQASGASGNLNRVLAGGSRSAASSSVGWYGTLRPRIGYTFDRTLLYVTGGLAYGKLKSRVSGVDGFGNTFSTSTGPNRVGWTIGAGVEQAISQHWSAKLEYGYVDLGRNTAVGAVRAALGAATGAVVSTRARIQFHTVRAGVNYRF